MSGKDRVLYPIWLQRKLFKNSALVYWWPWVNMIITVGAMHHRQARCIHLDFPCSFPPILGIILNLHLKSWLSLPLKSKTGFPGSVSGKEPVCQCRRCKREIEVWSLGGEDPLEEEMATHSSILAWRIQWKEEPGRLQCTGSQRVEYAWSDLAHMHTHTFQNRSFHLGCKSNHFSN